jgi:hypothetical protein
VNPSGRLQIQVSFHKRLHLAFYQEQQLAQNLVLGEDDIAWEKVFEFHPSAKFISESLGEGFRDDL